MEMGSCQPSGHHLRIQHGPPAVHAVGPTGEPATHHATLTDSAGGLMHTTPRFMRMGLRAVFHCPRPSNRSPACLVSTRAARPMLALPLQCGSV
jgi:hypothetical protein